MLIPGVASAADWNGSADFSWNTPGNWTGGVPDGAADVANFTGAAPGTITLDDGADQMRTLATLSFTGAGYTLAPGSPASALSLNSGTITQNVAGANTISAQLLATNTTFNVTNGTLALRNSGLLNVNNLTGSTINIGAGATFDAGFGGVRPGAPGASGSNSIEGATVNLNGGTLLLSGAQFDNGSGGLTGVYYNQQVQRNARIEFQSLRGITGLLNTSNPETLGAPNTGFTNAISDINFPSGAAPHFPSVGFTTGDNLLASWKGKFVAPSTGTYDFGANSDDGLMLFIDGQLIINRNNFQGFSAGSAGSINLTAGLHDIYVAFYEGGGNAGAIVYENAAGTDVLDLADTIAAQPHTVLGNNVAWTASSTIAPDNTYGVALGTLDANTAGTTLTTGRTVISGQPSLDGLTRFTSTNFNASGTFTFNTQSDIALGTLSDGPNTVTITKTGPGNLILDSTGAIADTNGTTINVQEGGLVAQRINTGNNPLGTALIQLNGAGTVLQLRTNETTAGNQTFDNAVQITANARIESLNHSTTARELVLGSAANGITVSPGLTLEVYAAPMSNLRLHSISGVGVNVDITPLPDTAQTHGFVFFNAANTFTGRLTVRNGNSLRLDNANAMKTQSVVDVESNGRLELFANNTFDATSPRIFSRSGTFFRLNGTSNPSQVISGGVFDVGPGRIVEIQTGNPFTGAGTVRMAPGAIYRHNTANIEAFDANNTTVGLRGQDFPRLNIFQVTQTINGAGDGVINAGWGASPVGSVIQINGANRNITNSALQEMNGQIIINDASSRQMNDGVRLDINALGGTIAASSGTTLTVAENLLTTAASGKLTIGTHIPIDNRIGSGTVVFSHASAGDFTGTTSSADAATSIINGATLDGLVSASGASGLGGSPATSIGVALDRGAIRAIQPGTAVPGGFLNVGKVYATGAGVVAANRNAAGTIIELRMNAPITRSAGATLGIQGGGNAVGSDERIRFATLADAPARVGGMSMVAPWMVNTSGNIGSFVDYDPAQDPGTGVGFTNVAYTAVPDDATFATATATTIVDVTAATTLTADRAAGALRINGNLSGAFNIDVATGGIIISSAAADSRTIASNLRAPAGTELVLYSGGATGGIHNISGTLTSDSGFIKWGPRTLTLSGNNSTTLTGDITINDGSLTYTNNNNLGAPANRIVMNGGNLRVAAGSLATPFVQNREIVFNNGGGQLANDGNRVVEYSNVISGAGAVGIIGINGFNGVNRFTGASPNTFEGGLLINGGILEFTRNDQLGAAPTAADYDRGHVVISETGTTNATLRLVSGAGAVTTTGRQYTLLGNARVEVAGAGDSLTVDADMRGSGGLTKLGPGSLILGNALGNGYSGNTTVSAGTLLVNNTAFTGTGTGTVTVSTGATLGGSGIVEGAVTASTGSTLAPGSAANTAGRFTGQDGLTIQNDAAYLWTLASETTSGPGVNFDQVLIERGTVNVNAGADLTFNFLAGAEPSADAFWTSPQTWTGILQLTHLASAGTIADPDIDNTTWASLGTFSTVTGPAGIDLVWTPVPEPGSLATVVAAAGLLLARRRRRA